MTYKVVLKPAAQRQLKKLSPTIQGELVTTIEKLREDPRPSGCKKLKGRQNQYRIRLGNYRVIYGIEDSILVVRVIKVGHRRDVYEES